MSIHELSELNNIKGVLSLAQSGCISRIHDRRNLSAIDSSSDAVIPTSGRIGKHVVNISKLPFFQGKIERMTIIYIGLDMSPHSDFHSAALTITNGQICV